MKLLTIVLIAGAVAVLPAIQLVPATAPQGFDYKWATTQGGLLIALLVVLWSYRRDIMRKFGLEVKRLEEEKRVLYELVQGATKALQENAVQLALQTTSNHRVAKAVDRIER